MTKVLDDFLNKCLILDTETDSDDYKVAEVIEAGYATYSSEKWEYNQELFSTSYGKVPPKIQSICYINNSMVNSKPTFSQGKDSFEQVICNYRDGYLVAHNHFFDMRVLQRYGINTEDYRWICTWRLAKKLFMDHSDIIETNLPYLRFALELDVPIDMICHRAGHDSLITGLLLVELVKIMVKKGLVDVNDDIGQQVYQYSSSPVIYSSMPFGKHKGQKFIDIPGSYWDWAIKNTQWFNSEADNFDPDLIASIGAALNLE